MRQHRRNFNDPGHAHELAFSCYRRFPFLGADRTCAWLAEAINDARAEHQFDLWAYVSMPDHVHLIVHPREIAYDIAQIRKAIKAPVAIRAIQYMAEHAPDWLAKITRQRGGKVERLFWESGGGYDRNIIDGETLMQMIDYIHLNPVRKRLAEHAIDWKWSSAAWFQGASHVPMLLDRIPAEWLREVKR